MSTYPYQYKTIDVGKIINPLILLPVKTSWGWQDLWFLLDSGADTTTIPLPLGQQLGLSINPSVTTKLYGIGDHAVYASFGTIVIRLGVKEISVRSYFIDVQDSDLLLGRLDVFDKFTITFDRKKQATHFHSNSKFGL